MIESNNKHIIEILEGEMKLTEKILEEIMAKNFPYLMTDANIHIHEAQ